MLARIRQLGYPAALVAQDGLQPRHVPWDEIDYLFLGGSTDWKLSPAAARLTHHAHAHSISVHCGRTNSRRRLQYAAAIGCTSADGTYLAYGPDRNLPRLLAWLAELDNPPQQPEGDHR